MTADFDTIREALVRLGPIPDWSVNERAEEALAALARVQAAAEQAEKILAADEVCACLDETGGRQVRMFERCERCHALMESDLPGQLAEQSEGADEWREQWEKAEQRAELAERALKDAQMKERALTDYFADASRRADQERERAERAERDRSDLIRNGLTDLTETARKLERAERERDEAKRTREAALTLLIETEEATEAAEADNRAMQQEADELEAELAEANGERSLATVRAEQAERERDEANDWNRGVIERSGLRVRAEAAEARGAVLTERWSEAERVIRRMRERPDLDSMRQIAADHIATLFFASPDTKEGT